MTNPTPASPDVPEWAINAAKAMHRESWHNLAYESMVMQGARLIAQAHAKHATPPVSALGADGAKLRGKLVRAGAFIASDEEVTGLVIAMSREELESQKHIPMMQEVFVVPVATPPSPPTVSQPDATPPTSEGTELEEWRATFEGWGEKPREAYNKIIAAAQHAPAVPSSPGVEEELRELLAGARDSLRIYEEMDPVGGDGDPCAVNVAVARIRAIDTALAATQPPESGEKIGGGT